MLTRSTILLCCLALMSACGSDPGPGDADGGTTPVDAGGTPVDAGSAVDAFRPPTDGGPMGPTTTVRTGPYTLPIGVERTQCIVVDAGNEAEAYVRAIRTTLTQGSHHMILYRTTEALRPDPVDCFPFAMAGSAFYIAESPMEELLYPEGAGLLFDAHQHIRIEMHQVNYVGEPIEVMGTAEFEFYDASVPTPSPVQLLFEGPTSINLPPHASTTVTGFVRAPAGARVFALTSHTHSLGRLATIHRGRSTTDTTELLHQSDSWADPPLDHFSPALTFSSGEGFALACEFLNDTERTVGFGLDFEDEMCFLWAYWY